MYGGTARLHEARGDPIDGASRRGHVRSGHRQQLTDNKVSIQSSQTPPVVGQSSNGSRTQQSDNTDRVSEAAGTSDKANDSKITLKKELNVISGTSVVIGLIIGSGIFITPNTILSHSHSFGFTMILWAAGGLVALFGGLCFCELAALVKRSGSTYAFILEGYSFRQKYRWLSPLGSLLAFLNIWSNTLIAQPTAIAVILLTFGRYLCRPFFISCSEVPIIPVKMFALFALCKNRPLSLSLSLSLSLTLTHSLDHYILYRSDNLDKYLQCKVDSSSDDNTFFSKDRCHGSGCCPWRLVLY